MAPAWFRHGPSLVRHVAPAWSRHDPGLAAA